MTGRQDVFQQAMNQGHSAAWDQGWEKAASFYKQALEEFPENPQALTSLGLALIELQDFDEALHCYIKAAKAIPEDPLPAEKIAQLNERMGNLDQASQASLRAAELYLKNRDVNKAIENWERVTRLNPENLQAHSRLAMVYERTGEKSKAVTEYLAVASLMQNSGDLEKSLRSVNQALTIMPNNEEVIQALNMLKDFKQLPKPTRSRGATAPLRMSQVRLLQLPDTISQAELDPAALAGQKALTVLAGLLFDVGEDEQNQSQRRDLNAIVAGNEQQAKPGDRTKMMLHLSQVVDLQTRGENTQAAEELQHAIDAGLEHPAAFFDLGYLYAQSGRLESAIRQLQHAVRHVDFVLGARLLMGDMLRKKGQLKEASLEYLEALRLADLQTVPPEQANDLRQLYEPIIESHRQQSDVAVQTRLCDNIHQMLMRPDWLAQLRRTREQLPNRGGKMLPTPLAEILTQVSSNQMIESLSIIYDLMNHDNLQSAMEEAFFALQHAPTYLPLHTIMGNVMVAQGDLQGAVNKYEVVARTYSTRGETQQAIDLYRKMVELSPADLNARRRLIDQLTAYGKMEDAVNEYLQLAEVYVRLADLSSARQTYTEALRAGQQANVERSLRIKVMYRMADIDLQSLDWRQAMRIFEQIRTLQPDDQEARHNLVDLNLRLGQEQQALAELDNYMSYLTSHNQVEKAVEFLVGLTRDYPKNISIRRRLADLYKQLGQTKQAVNQLDAIGESLLDAGDRSGAIQTIEMILGLNPPNRTDYQKLLEQLRKG